MQEKQKTTKQTNTGEGNFFQLEIKGGPFPKHEDLEIASEERLHLVIGW